MKQLFFLLVLMIMATSMANAQVGINADNSAPDPSAGLDVKFTDKGMLPPRMTVDQRDAIASPAEGLMVYCTNCGVNGSLSLFTNGAWRTYTFCNTPSPLAGSNSVSPGQIIWNWTAVAGASGYKWNTTPGFNSATDMGTATTKTETGISCGTTYTRYVWVYSVCGISAPVTLSQTVHASVPTPPTAATNIGTQTSIVWKWHPVNGATGYKWSATNNFSLATDMGTDTTTNETGLTCETAYTRYMWSYNGCGYSAPVVLTQSTLSCWACGIPITVNHEAGEVAPVSKTPTYGTVTNIPGELTKCWITSNLGSDHQATAVSDATEASAGWYWQFNRKQGYKHDGSIRTPSTTWISSINESSEWITDNDPCTIELGTGWRIPTNTEWNNVSGSWTNWTGPYSSALKLHAAGSLNSLDGSLIRRGLDGYEWSSVNVGTSYGWRLYFFNSGCFMASSSMAYGFSARCVRDN